MQRPVLGPVLFSMIISDLEGMTQCTPGKFAGDTNLGGPVAMLEGRAAFWDRQEGTFMKFNKDKSKVLPLGKKTP